VNHTRKSESGQVLVLVVAGMIALIGMAGLAIDGGNIYSDRRHAQTAADTAGMATGLTWVRDPSNWNLAHLAGMDRADNNGYDDNGTSNTVEIHQCDEAGVDCNLPAMTTLPGGVADTPAYYIQTTITSHVPTYLARVLGIPEMTNTVQSLTHAVPSFAEQYYHGAGLVSLMPSCKPPDGSWPNDPFTLTGNEEAIVRFSGVFVNSDCSNAYTQANGTTLLTPEGGTCVVGGLVIGDHAVVDPYPDDYCGTPVDLQTYKVPSVTSASCPDPGVISGSGGDYTATPGYYNDTFPKVSPAGTIKLKSGIYCFNRGMSFSSQWTVTTDLDGNGVFDRSDGAPEGVLLYVPGGSVTFNGGTTVHLGAMNNTDIPEGIRGYLIYVPDTNPSPVKIAGSNGSTFIGTILAPRSFITLEGGSSTDSLNLECQIIGYSIRLTGGGTLDISYYENKVAQGWTNPILEPYR
jgi:hypothetical protein